MDSPTTPSTRNKVWILWLSIAMQQIVFLLAFGYRVQIPLITVSEWVIFVPVVIVWSLYAVIPPLTAKKDGKNTLLRTYASLGWVFVFAASSWTVSYVVLSKNAGTPVSYEQILKLVDEKMANQSSTAQRP